MYSEYLRLHQCRVVEIGNTERALRVAPMADVVVTGIRVRGPFDGLELVRRLRADERTRTKPIIVLTACAFDSDRESARQAGSDVFLSKPCLPDTLVTEIGGVLRRRLPHLRAAHMTFGSSTKRQVA
jgi:two-component system, cell cycle response regulator DivK